MATSKKKQMTRKENGSVQAWKISWKNLFIAASVSANIAFIVVIITMMTSHSLDGMFIKEGLTRYCASDNNDKFAASATNVQALRAYTCASGDAKAYFNEGFQKYVDSKATKE